MSAFADIQSALMAAWAGVLPYPCICEGKAVFVDSAGVEVAKPDNSPWCAVYVLPASSAVAGLGQGAPIEHVVLQ